jgi:CubicO group peptidase (beta-lactamase class C family)
MIRQAAQAAVAKGVVPACSIRVQQKGELIFEGGFGQADLEQGTAASPDSVYRIGSITKQFAAALVLRLCEQKKITLDDPMHRYLPFFRNHAPFSVREALHHTAGLHEDEETGPANVQGKAIQVQLARLIARQKKVFDFAPGTAWRYSNANYIVLGALIETVAGRDLSDFATDELFVPLGLKRTAVDRAQDVVAGRANGYAAGGSAHFEHAPFIDVLQAGAAGAMRSTCADLCHWHSELLSGRVLQASTLQQMLAPGRLRNGKVSGSRRFLAEDAHYGDTQYAMGLLVSPTGKRLFHFGFIPGFSSYLDTDVETGLTLAVLCSTDMGPNSPITVIRRLVHPS